MDDDRELLIDKLLDIPKECIVNQVIPKKVIFEEANLNSSDKAVFTEFVRQFKWYAKFAESTIRIPKYSDEIREYEEVEIINIILKDENIHRSTNSNSYFKEDKKIDRILDIIFRFMPFPLLIVVQFKKEIRLFVSHISNHLSDSTKITVDEVISSNWIDTMDMNELEINLFNNIQPNNLDFTNCYTFYTGFVDNLIHYNGSIKVGHDISLRNDEIKEINDEIDKLNKEIDKLMIDLNNETQPPLIADLNDEIRERLIKRDTLFEKLKQG